MTIKPIEKFADSDDDPVETMLKKTGCLELHYKVQVCNIFTILTVFFNYYFYGLNYKLKE